MNIVKQNDTIRIGTRFSGEKKRKDFRPLYLIEIKSIGIPTEPVVVSLRITVVDSNQTNEGFFRTVFF